MDLQKLSRKKLEALAGDIQEEIMRRRKARAQELHNEIMAQIAKEGYAVEDILPVAAKKKAKKKIPIKYRNPDNHTQTWTGRGRTPVWAREKLAKGATLEDFQV